MAQLIPLTPYGKYTLIARIGMGGMAEVFLAALSGPGGFRKLLVLKRLHPHLEAEEGFLEMFLDEARLAARLHHPNVVQTYEVGEEGGEHYLAMEHLDGQPLNRVMRKCAGQGIPLPLELAVRIASDALEGLEYAHRLCDFDGTPFQVVHRDISPANIFVTYSGEVKLLDFGIAKAAQRFTQTRAGQVKGKFAYMAPEQARDEGSDQRADLFSMGVVLWELLTGRRLFKADNEIATFHNVLGAKIPTPSSLGHTPESISALAMRALARDREARFGSALEMREALTRAGRREAAVAGRAELSKFMTALFENERAENARLLERCMSSDMPVTDPGAPVPNATAPRPSEEAPNDTWEPPTLSHFRTSPERERSDRRKRFVFFALVSICAIAVGAGGAVLLRSDVDEGVLASGVQYGPIVPAPLPPAERREAAPEPAPEPALAAVIPVALPTVPTEVVPAIVAPAPNEPAPVEARPSPRPAREDRRRRATRTTERTVSATQETEPAPNESAEMGFLTLDTTPWANVSLNGRSLGTTPLLRTRLPAGEHILVLTNPEQSLRTTYRVRVTAGATVVRRIGLE